MTQHGPYPGQPSQPWSPGGAGDPYREPSDPWAGPAPETDSSSFSTRPTGVEYGRPAAKEQPGAWATPGSPKGAEQVPPAAPPPRKRGRDTRVTVLVAVVGLLFCGGLAMSAWLLIQSPSPGDHATTALPTPTAGRPTTPANANPGPPPSSKDARFVTKGQCVRNEGTADVPEMTISVCASGAYQVLARVDGRTTGEADAEAKCAKVPNYSKWYLYDSDLDSLDFVLCLKER